MADGVGAVDELSTDSLFDDPCQQDDPDDPDYLHLQDNWEEN